MQEIVQLLTVLFSLSGFGIDANPKAPPPSEVIRYGMDGADVFLYLDVEAIAPRNVRAFAALPDHPELKDAAEVRAQIAQAVAGLEMARAGMKATTGIDPVTDVKSIALWASASGPQPEMLFAVRGVFPADLVDKVSQVGGGEVTEVAGTRVAHVPANGVAVAVAGGQLLAGDRKLVEARLAKGWRRTTRTEAPYLAGKPFFSALARPSEAARARLGGLDDDLRHVVQTAQGMVSASLTLRHNGVGWHYEARDRKGFETAALASDGVILLMRSAHLFGRAAARIALASLRTFGGDDPRLAAVFARERELLALVDSFTGDGRFVASVNRAPAKNTVTVKASGARLSQVVPLGGMLPLVGAAAFLASKKQVKEAASAPAPAAAATPAVAAPVRRPSGRPLDVRGVYRRARARHP